MKFQIFVKSRRRSQGILPAANPEGRWGYQSRPAARAKKCFQKYVSCE